MQTPRSSIETLHSVRSPLQKRIQKWTLNSGPADPPPPLPSCASCPSIGGQSFDDHAAMTSSSWARCRPIKPGTSLGRHALHDHGALTMVVCQRTLTLLLC
jgi:hypothetical protein